MKTKIYLRSVLDEGEDALSLFDSERHGGINDLVTEVEAGTKVVWKLDKLSGIKDIANIYFKSGKDNSIGSEPRKKAWRKRWVLKIPKEARGEEAYGIEYIKCDNEKKQIDPLIKVKPPK